MGLRVGEQHSESRMSADAALRAQGKGLEQKVAEG